MKSLRQIHLIQINSFFVQKIDILSNIVSAKTTTELLPVQCHRAVLLDQLIAFISKETLLSFLETPHKHNDLYNVRMNIEV